MSASCAGCALLRRPVTGSRASQAEKQERARNGAAVWHDDKPLTVPVLLQQLLFSHCLYF